MPASGAAAAPRGASLPSGRDGSIYVTCGTDSPNLPRVGRGSRPYQGQEDGYIAKLNRSGASLDWATYLGGSDFDGLSPTLRVDRKGHLDIVGSTASTDFPVRRGRP